MEGLRRNVETHETEIKVLKSSVNCSTINFHGNVEQIGNIGGDRNAAQLAEGNKLVNSEEPTRNAKEARMKEADRIDQLDKARLAEEKKIAAEAIKKKEEEQKRMEEQKRFEENVRFALEKENARIAEEKERIRKEKEAKSLEAENLEKQRKKEEAKRVQEEEQKKEKRIAREAEEKEKIRITREKEIARILCCFSIFGILVLGLGLGLGLPRYPERLLVSSSGPAAVYQSYSMGLYKKTNRTHHGRPVWEKVGGRTKFYTNRFMYWDWGQGWFIKWCLADTELGWRCFIHSKFDLLPRIPRSGWRYNGLSEWEPDPTLTVAGK